MNELPKPATATETLFVTLTDQANRGTVLITIYDNGPAPIVTTCRRDTSRSAWVVAANCLIDVVGYSPNRHVIMLRLNCDDRPMEATLGTIAAKTEKFTKTQKRMIRKGAGHRPEGAAIQPMKRAA